MTYSDRVKTIVGWGILFWFPTLISQAWLSIQVSGQLQFILFLFGILIGFIHVFFKVESIDD